ncbi:MAG: hypothetical protein MUF20_14385 [Methylotetracoccus sp.]|nr:hypothetical protein [Methylotetracoccus sp.]
MTLLPWHEEPIGKHQDREGFDCSEPALNDFLRHHARKSHERGGAKTFLAVADADRRQVFGFYSLSPASVAYARTPAVIRQGLARYEVPVFRLGRLAVARTAQSQGLGGQLLLLAGRRCLCGCALVRRVRGDAAPRSAPLTPPPACHPPRSARRRGEAVGQGSVLLDSLRDTKGRIAVLRRIDRLMDGNNVLLRALGLRIAVQPLGR